MTDAQRQRIEASVPGKAGDRGATGKDNRPFVDAVLWLVRTGAPRRDPPAEFGHGGTVRRRFDRWAKAGAWRRRFEAPAADPGSGCVIVAATIVRAHALVEGLMAGWVVIADMASGSDPFRARPAGQGTGGAVAPSDGPRSEPIAHDEHL